MPGPRPSAAAAATALSSSGSPAEAGLKIRTLLVAGLGNASHPLTRHSVGQLLAQNLLRRACADPACLARTSPALLPARFGPGGKHKALCSARVSIRGPARGGGAQRLDLWFVIPKAAMNICGPTIAAAYAQHVPPAQSKSSSHLDAPPDLEVDPVIPPTPSSDGRRAQSKRHTPPPPPPPSEPLHRLLTLQDDLDLSPSVLKYQRAGGPRGHNGVRSVSSPGALGTNRFHRLWVGIGRPEERSEVARWVLSPLSREEVRRCEFEEGEGRGGEVLERAWNEVLRIGFEEEEP